MNLAFAIDQPGRRIREFAVLGIAGALVADQINVQHPAVTKAGQRRIHVLG